MRHHPSGAGRIIRAVVALAIALGASMAAHADEVRLRTSVVIPGDRPVVVSDVAILTGDEAMKGAGAIIAKSAADLAQDSAGRTVVGIGRVRDAMAQAGVMMARIAMSGSTCIVRSGGGGTASTPAEQASDAPQTRETSPESRPAYTVSADDGAPVTVRRRVAEAMAREYGVTPEHIRITFDPRDDALLTMEESGRTVIVRPTTTGNSSRPLVDVRVVSGERVVANGTVSADLEIWQNVVIAAGDIARRSEMNAGMVREEERWIAPGSAPLLGDAGAIEGQRAARRVRTGDVMFQSDLEAIIAVKRGEVVIVECVRNGISIQTKARALGDGCVGDRVECRMGDSKKSFIGTVDAPGRVVVVLGPEQLAAATR